MLDGKDGGRKNGWQFCRRIQFGNDEGRNEKGSHADVPRKDEGALGCNGGLAGTDVAARRAPQQPHQIVHAVGQRLSDNLGRTGAFASPACLRSLLSRHDLRAAAENGWTSIRLLTVPVGWKR